MPQHLYLPAEHSDADLMLAADVAAAVSSSDLYVTWTLESGAGAPEVEAIMREEAEQRPPNLFLGFFAAIGRTIALVWRHLAHPPEQHPPAGQLRGATGHRTADEPSF